MYHIKQIVFPSPPPLTASKTDIGKARKPTEEQVNSTSVCQALAPCVRDTLKDVWLEPAFSNHDATCLILSLKPWSWCLLKGWLEGWSSVDLRGNGRLKTSNKSLAGVAFLTCKVGTILTLTSDLL